MWPFLIVIFKIINAKNNLVYSIKGKKFAPHEFSHLISCYTLKPNKKEEKIVPEVFLWFLLQAVFYLFQDAQQC